MRGKKPSKKAGKRRKPNVSRSTRAELQFPVSRVDRHLHHDRYAQRLSSSTPVFLAGVLEYLTSNILELAGEEAHKNSRVRITPEHMRKAIESSEHLRDLLEEDPKPRDEDVAQPEEKE
ncbi:histone H2A-Bbd type 1-like [Oryctolagus cuniculus]|uniref:Histone H2A n=1 Tax=Oryctolagus cuniculus TaxID=9986 RepID=A0A5F9DGB2_RABIT|nr:histone H2A-Bbd type 1 [Oryctolagus cuniculus]XP_002720059.1 histone H2A-Bbd type 1-like [Oryctolagus cuniculus]